MENPAPPSTHQLPAVDTGSKSGSAPRILPRPTVRPSPSQNLEGSEPTQMGNLVTPPVDQAPAPPTHATAPPTADPAPVADPTAMVDDPMESGENAQVTTLDLSGDDPMDSAVVVAPANVDVRLSMAELLQQQEHLRRDRAVIEATRRRVETPKPLAVDIEAIERQYAAGGDWSHIASRMEQARPYQLPTAKYDMVIETGRALAKTPLQKIMASLASTSHGNATLDELYQRFEIGQISKLPGGNLRVKVKTKEACVRLERTKVNILGGVFSFKEFDILGDKYFIDIVNVDPDVDVRVIVHRLFLLGCQPVYHTFREVNLATGMTSATWRVYFLSSSCPSALVVNGSVCDQVLFDNKLHPAHGKNAPFQSERQPYGYRSHHGIDLGTPDSVFPPTKPAPEQPQQQRQQPPKTYAQAASAKPKQTSLQKAVEEGKKREAQLQQRAQHGKSSAETALAKPRSNSDAISIATFDDSQGKMTPPGSPKPPMKSPTLLLTNGNDGFSTVINKKKRSRNGVDFSNMLVKQQPQPLDGVATTNYFQVLQSMEVSFEVKDVAADKKYGPRYQVIPVDVKRPEALKTSTESAFFVEKHHTKIRKASKASPILEVSESMLNDENTALLNTLPDRLALADTQVEGASKLIDNATNPDHVIKKAVDSPLAFNSALSLKMAGTGHGVAELAQLHLINRVLSATQPSEDVTFSSKWKKHMKTAVPSKRDDMFKTCAKWWRSSEQISELSRATKALGFFELMLMSIAPTIFSNDHWIHYITGQPVEWIPAHHTRLLHPNTLLMLLRSDLGAHCLSQWNEVQWQGYLLDDLEELRKLDGYYPVDESVLQLRVVEGEVVLKNGHLFIDSVLSKHSVACVQETKLSDRTHLSKFKFHLDSSFKHRVFVNDPNSQLDRPTRGRSNGVLTVLRSDFPGFDTAEEVSQLSVPGRYIVVKVMVEGAPIYIHNVYAPVDQQEKQQFFSSLDTEGFEDQATHFVLGDLNTPLDPRLDSSSPDLHYDPGRSSCLEWLAKLGVVDAWRIHYDTKRVFTGPLPRKNRLDYILLSEDFYTRFYDDSKYFLPKHAGDHLAHTVSFRSGSQLHGRGYWKFPRYLLEYPLVVSAIEKEAEMVLDKLRTSTYPGKVWEKWKESIKSQLQDVQKKLRMQDTAAIEEAQAALDQAAARYRDASTENNRSEYEEAMKMYKETVTRTSQHNQDTAFDFQAANSEKSTKHFFRPLDTSLRRVSIEGVVTPSGSVSSNPQEISLRFLEHWGSEMGDSDSPAGRAPPPDEAVQRKLLDSIVRFTSETDRDILNAPVTSHDLADAIRHMKATSAPGMDGLTAGFYQVAPDVFGECLSLVFNDQLRRGVLLPSQRKSAVVLLHKKGSRAQPGNYRPIALIPVDAKVLSKALTYRLQSVVPDLVHTDQKGFVKGRSIHHHVRFLADLQDLVTSRDEEAYALFLDFEKAFDRVNWDYMFRVLERMGCGSDFLQWVRLLYTEPQAHLVINQNIQPALFPTRGVKQGDPLSALLFLLTIEPLGNLLRSHEEFGVCLTEDHTSTSVFFADDTTLLGGSIASVQAQLELVEEYCNGSGAKLNLGKSNLMALNRNEICPQLPGVHVLGRAESVKFLGIPFSQSPVNDDIVNFLEQRFYDGFKMWYRRARTLRGRLLVAQTMVLSRLWHYTQHVSIPSSVVKRWQSMLNRFVLSRKHDRDASHIQLIPKEFLYLPRSDGGLQIPCIEAQLKRQRLQHLLQFMRAVSKPDERSWTTPSAELLTAVLPRVGRRTALDFLTVSPLRHGTMIKWELISVWWKETWVWWYKIRWEISWHDLPTDERVQYGLHQPIWFHSDPDLHYEQTPRSLTANAHRRCLGMCPEPQRGFRLHISRVFGLRSLADFMRGSNLWPSETDFVQRHLDLTLASVALGVQSQWLRSLYREATQIAVRLGVRELALSEEDRSQRRTFPHLGCKSGSKVCLVPSIPRSALLRVVWKPTPPNKPHPMTLHNQSIGDEEIKGFVNFSKHLRRILLPVFEDLQFRLAFRLLPVRSRFWFLQTSNPRVVYCVRDGCDAIETEKHLFFECALAARVWEHVRLLMALFFRSHPTWIWIATAKKPVIQDDWKECEDVICDVWHTLRAVALHFLWSDRNRCLFDGRQPTPVTPAMAVIYTTKLAAQGDRSDEAVRTVWRLCEQQINSVPNPPPSDAAALTRTKELTLQCAEELFSDSPESELSRWESPSTEPMPPDTSPHGAAQPIALWTRYQVPPSLSSLPQKHQRPSLSKRHQLSTTQIDE
ncbi:putative Pollike protein, partial [Globisporangium splendens]